MSAIAEGEGKRRRKSRLPSGPLGARLVRDELLKRGFDARLADHYTKKYDILVGRHGSPPMPVHVRTVHVGSWYIRNSHFVGARANQVTVFVLIGVERNSARARFFVTRNGDMESELRQPVDRRDFGLINIGAVQQYEDNWDLLGIR